MRTNLPKWNQALALLITAGFAGTASASLTSSYQFNGKGNWSIDAVGGNNTPVGILQASVPVGATIQKAFLYSSMFATAPVPSVTFQGTTYSGAAWTSLGSNNIGLTAYRTDVTSQVAGLAGGGSASLFNWTVNAENPNSSIDGEVLAIIYSLPSETERTIAFLDGFSNTTGDSTTVNFASPLTAAQLADPSFSAQLSLGIGFSTGNSQSSTVDISGNRLTSSAGGFDDGSLENGGLITAGGIGDNPANPLDPNSNTSPDDELYTLNSFLSAGMTSFNINTRNPSNDDNIFFASLNITAVAGVNEPPPTSGVPDSGSTVALLGAAFAGLSFASSRLKRSA